MVTTSATATLMATHAYTCLHYLNNVILTVQLVLDDSFGHCHLRHVSLRHTPRFYVLEINSNGVQTIPLRYCSRNGKNG